MSAVTIDSRPRCAVGLRLLAACALLSWTGSALAQEVGTDEYFSDEFYGAGEPGFMGDGCGDCCGSQHCSSGGRYSSIWLGAEYLGWTLEGSDLPPLVTDGPASQPIDEAGRLDNPTTRILSGNHDIGDDWRHGYRVFGGIRIDPCSGWSLGADYFRIGDDDYSFSAGPSSNRIITRPFFNTQTGQNDTELVNVPDELSGNVGVFAGDDFEGAGLTLQRCLWQTCDPCGCGPSALFHVLGGYRYYHYDSDLAITENLLVLPNTTSPLVPGTQIFVQDLFSAHTEFHGGEVGVQGVIAQSGWWVDGLIKVAVGSNRRSVTIDGNTINTVPGAGTAEFKGGLLTSEVTNIGHYTDRSLAIIPEFRLGIGRVLTQNLSVGAGYSVIIWNPVARAADQLPPGLQVDPRNLPPVQAGGGPDPVFLGIGGSSLVAHGLDVGIQWTY